MFHYNVPII